MRVRLLAASVLLLALAGCTSAPAPVSTSAPTATAPAVAALVPRKLAAVDQSTAGAEAKRLADAVQGLIASSEIVYVDDHAQYTPASGEQAAYFGVVRLISIEPADDPTVTAASMIASLEASGWKQTHTTDQGEFTSTSLVSTIAGQTWLILLGGDATVEGQSVVELQLASPELP